MNIGPVNTSMPAAAAAGGGTASGQGAPVGEAAAAGDTNSNKVNIPNNNGAVATEEPNIPGGAPSPLKQMSTSDFLGLRQTYQPENMMDKLAKIFETIIALHLLEETVKNVNESLEEEPESVITEE